MILTGCWLSRATLCHVCMSCGRQACEAVGHGNPSTSYGMIPAFCVLDELVIDASGLSRCCYLRHDQRAGTQLFFSRQAQKQSNNNSRHYVHSKHGSNLGCTRCFSPPPKARKAATCRVALRRSPRLQRARLQGMQSSPHALNACENQALRPAIPGILLQSDARI